MMPRNLVLLFGLTLAMAQPAGALGLDGARSARCLSAAPVSVCEPNLHLAATRKPIDKSCLMVCEKWNGDTCEKFVMKCKGDPGYPTPSGGVRAPNVLAPQINAPVNSK